jgi:hypothetical protein
MTPFRRICTYANLNIVCWSEPIPVVRFGFNGLPLDRGRDAGAVRTHALA